MSSHRPNPFEHQRVPDAPDPQERLAQLKIELTEHETRIDYLTKQKDDLQTDITDLSKTVDDVKAALTDYGSKIKDLETHLHSLRMFYEQKHKMVMAAIGEKKDPIDGMVREFDYETDKLQARVNELALRLEEATQEAANATQHQAAKQAEYDAVKGYKDRVTGNLTDMDNLRTSINQADTSTDIATMYFEVIEFHDVLDKTHLISQHQLAVELRHKLGELEHAKEHARSRNAEMNRLQTEETKEQATLSNRIAGRRQSLLTEIQTKFPVPAQPAQSAAGTTGTPATGSTPSAPGAASTPIQ
jgi:chromosome segregation ATPase